MTIELGRAREERGKGVRLSDAERLARHQDIPIEEACTLLAIYPIEQLLPQRGYGLTHAAPQEIIGYTVEDLAIALDTMETNLSKGQKARLRLCTAALPTAEELDQCYLSMVASGFHVSRPQAQVIDGVPATDVVLTKGSPQWSVVIAALVPVFIIGLIAFGITRIETITKALVPILLILVGGIVLVAGLMRGSAERVAIKYAGLPKTEKKALAAR